MPYQPVQLAVLQNDASGLEALKNAYLTSLAARDAQVSALAVAEADLATKKAAVTAAANTVKADADTYIPA